MLFNLYSFSQRARHERQYVDGDVVAPGLYAHEVLMRDSAFLGQISPAQALPFAFCPEQRAYAPALFNPARVLFGRAQGFFIVHVVGHVILLFCRRKRRWCDGSWLCTCRALLRSRRTRCRGGWLREVQCRTLRIRWGLSWRTWRCEEGSASSCMFNDRNRSVSCFLLRHKGMHYFYWHKC